VQGLDVIAHGIPAYPEVMAKELAKRKEEEDPLFIQA
jgi:hypothetical protein